MAWIFGSFRLGSAETERFKGNLPGDFRWAIAIASSDSISSVFIEGTSPVYGLWEDGLRWETFLTSVGRPLDGERGALFTELAREGEGDALGERAVERVVIVVEGALETWAPGTARFCCPLGKQKKKIIFFIEIKIYYRTISMIISNQVHYFSK